MKVRSRDSVSEHEIPVREESAHYYITYNLGVLDKQFYEPVPTERWVDVTAECEDVNGYCQIHHGHTGIGKSTGYRLRKVTTSHLPHFTYFVVEKKESA
jgi:hypothetical protein